MMLMRRQKARLLKFLLIFVFALLITRQLYLLYTPAVPVHSWNDNRDVNEVGDKRLHFESEASFKERLLLQEKIQYGAMIKNFALKVFSQREGYNETFLDMLPLLRKIPNFRPAGCEGVKYNTSTARVSVIINYHNELLSLLLRTVYTVLNSIPPQNFKELILIDDGSDLTSYYHLRIVEPLVDSFTVPVQFFRFEDNKGLVFCRRFGAQKAVGDVILVLDSHIELAPGFLAPLLNITDNNYKAVAAPIFDFMETFENRYWHYDGQGFGYDLYFNWVFSDGPRTHEPWRTPGVMGGAFLVTKKRLEEIDYFGRGLVGWGGENIELSMKSWMCDGEMYFVPCSRCAHFAANRIPSIHGDRMKPENEMQNVATVAKSFFNDDEYAEYLRGRPNARGAPHEETVKINKYMLKHLNCSRDYTWIRRNLMMNIESYNGDTLIAHTLMKDDLCLAIYNDRNHWNLEPCREDTSIANRVRLSKLMELRGRFKQCADFGWNVPRLSSCHGFNGNQKIRYTLKDRKIRSGNDLCLTRPDPSSTTVIFEPCLEPTENKQQFDFKVIYHPQLISD